MTTYQVSAKHVSAEYAFDRTTVRVRKDGFDGKYNANHPKLGCGKSYPTAKEAIMDIFLANGCYQIVIH